MPDRIVPDFHLPTRIVVKPDVINDAGRILGEQGRRAVIITTAQDHERLQEPLERLVSSLSRNGMYCIVYDEIPSVANTEFIDTAVYFTKRTECDLVIGFGGMEAINAAKAIALLNNNFLFCEDIFEARNLEAPLKMVTIPAQPLFGFEILPLFYVTDIHDFSRRVYFNNALYPAMTIIDPMLAATISEEKTASSGISALALATESIISTVTNEFSNTYALKAMDLTFKYLVPAYRDPHNPQPRYPLAIASLMAGIAFSTSFLSVSLAIGMALSSLTPIPLETAVGLMLPHVMEYNLTASPGRYVQMAKVMDEDVRDITVIEAAIKAIEGVRRIEQDLDIPQRLSQFGISKSDFTSVASLTMSYPFMGNAPRPLNRDEIETILIAAY